VAKNLIGMGITQFVLSLRAHEIRDRTDGQLLKRFLEERDEAAFAALVIRHGPMVFSVCRRILGNSADAEDAFQATFLVLVRKARSLRSRAVLGDWLHGVARRTALKAKGAAAHRRLKEQAMAKPETQGGVPSRDDWLPVLDDELSSLPEKYRLPIVLCELEGRTRQEAAKQLGWPEGTVAGRLARARTMLAKRLTRRGVILPAGALAAIVPTKMASAHVPAMLVSNTIKAATLVAAGELTAEGVISAKVATLTGEVMKALLLSKLKTVATVFVVCALGGFGWVGYSSSFSQEVPGAGQGAKVERKVTKDSEKKQNPEPKQNEPFLTAEVGNVAGVIFPSKAGPTSQQLFANLQEMLDMRDFQNPMTLREALGLIYERFALKNKEMPILIDSRAFKDEQPDAADFYDTPIKFPPIPREISTATFLKIALSQIPNDAKAELLIRDGYLEITTEKRTSTPYLLKEKVIARIDNQSIKDIFQDLADKYGVSIIVDARVEDKVKTKVTANFRNDVTLEGALRMVSDMAGLKMVDMKSGLYITSSANAMELEKELRALEKERRIQEKERRILEKELRELDK